jgi:hypothetical protein
MRMSGRIGWGLLAAIAAAAVVVEVAASSAIHRLPLIPHHVQKARRLKEIREQHRELQIEEDFFDTASSAHQYRRREEASQVGALYHGYGTHYADGM